jgi:2-dehydro-3-deoxyphosphogluconate aldolase / (4S)-4-hydroxy-2-oxoglutarate aldolase
MMDSTLQRIGEVGIIPVIRAANVDEALRAVDAIYAGGIPIVEITMTIPDAPRALAKVLRQYGETIVAGAGTVLTTDDAMRCLDVGANFLVSPGLSIPVMAVARDLKVLAIPGALTPTEIMNALTEGARAIKVFPCSSAGGARHLKALRGPFPHVALIPTGGVNSSNAAEYIAAGAFALGAGGDLIDSESLTSGDTSKITNAAKDLVEAVRAARESCGIT